MAFNNQGIGGGALGAFKPSNSFGNYQQPSQPNIGFGQYQQPFQPNVSNFNTQPQNAQPQGTQAQDPNTSIFGNWNYPHSNNSFTQTQQATNPNRFPYLYGMPSWLTQNGNYNNNLMANRPNNQLFATIFGNQG